MSKQIAWTDIKSAREQQIEQRKAEIIRQNYELAEKRKNQTPKVWNGIEYYQIGEQK